MHNIAYSPPTDRVVSRLRAEGWVNCLDLEVPALSATPILNLREFVLAQLRAAQGQLWEVDLQLNTLIFSIPAHEFQVHPQLQSVLRQLEAEQLIAVQQLNRPGRLKGRRESVITLRQPNPETLPQKNYPTEANTNFSMNQLLELNRSGGVR